MKIHHLKAFTIMEMTIAMLLASITIGLTYTVYTIFSRSYNAYNEKNKTLAIPVKLNQLLNHDFDKALIISKTDSGLVFNNDSLPVNYEFTPTAIIRKQSLIDTFKVSLSNLVIEFEKDTTTSKVDELQFNLLIGGNSVPFHYFKRYSSVNLMQ